eukprot:COSAG02_NODE_5873_length_3972_cov_20.899045_6_plen_108_part_00
MQPGIDQDERGEGDEGDEGDESTAVRIGLLLDLDAGSLTVYKNDVRLGNMVDGRWSEGGALEGQYSWALATRRQGAHFERNHACADSRQGQASCSVAADGPACADYG